MNFKKSSYSAITCVTVAQLGDGTIGVRDSKVADGPMLSFTADEWAAFVAGVKNNEFDFGTSNMTQTPSVGRICHYVSHGTPVQPDGSQTYTSVCRAAIVTEVSDNAGFGPVVGLCVLNPTGQFFNRGVEQDERTKAGGTWHWPERVS